MSRTNTTTDLQCLIPNPIRLVNEHIWSSTDSDFAGSFVNGNRLEGLGVVDIDRLEELLRIAEDDKCMAGDVSLARRHILELFFCYLGCRKCGFHTTMRKPSHSAVLNDWSFAGGRPGRTARIEAVVGETLNAQRGIKPFLEKRYQKETKLFKRE